MQQAFSSGTPEFDTRWAHATVQQDKQFQSSIDALLSIAKDEAGAEGYALFEHEEGKGTLVLRSVEGAWREDSGRASRKTLLEEVRRPASGSGHHDDRPILSFPLQGHTGLAGVLEFAFAPHATISSEQRDTLERTAAAVAAILRRTRAVPFVLRLAARVAGLEAQLADLKIAERAGGLAHHRSRARRAEVLQAHVASVLESSEVADALANQIKTLELKLDERRVIGLAKTTLQKTLSLTEEEAYLRLRETSRRTRTRLIEVARRVLDQSADGALSADVSI